MLFKNNEEITIVQTLARVLNIRWKGYPKYNIYNIITSHRSERSFY